MMIKTVETGATIGIDPLLVLALAASIDGSVVLPVDEEYDRLRLTWSARLEDRPAVIVRAASERDIQLATRFANQFGLPFAVGLDGAGSASGGVMVDPTAAAC
jgi:FAD/FMN-containing dehydrogenase